MVDKLVSRQRTREVSIEVVLETVLFTGSAQKLYSWIIQGAHQSAICTRLSTFPMYDYITKLCRRQAEVIQNHATEHVCGIGQGETSHRIYKRLKLGSGQAYDRSSE
jgi:hypothetical protein